MQGHLPGIADHARSVLPKLGYIGGTGCYACMLVQLVLPLAQRELIERDRELGHRLRLMGHDVTVLPLVVYASGPKHFQK